MATEKPRERQETHRETYTQKDREEESVSAPTKTAVTAAASIPRAIQREQSPHGRFIKDEERLGSGAYKDVWRAYDTQEGIEVAWNVVKLSKIPANERKRLKTEIRLLKTLNHPNIIKYFSSWVDREREMIIFVTELLSNGSLKDYITNYRVIRWTAVKRWCRQILKGLMFLHTNNIIHRDIKCDNIFVNGATGDIRIGDLGLSTTIADERYKSTKRIAEGPIETVAMTCLGTPEFMAPELYEETYDNKVDIYAFGMCVLEMVTQKVPYSSCTSAAQIYKKVVVDKQPPSELELVLSVEARRFIQLCLTRDPNERPSADVLLTHTFLGDTPEDNRPTIEQESQPRVEETPDDGDGNLSRFGSAEASFNESPSRHRKRYSESSEQGGPHGSIDDTDASSIDNEDTIVSRISSEVNLIGKLPQDIPQNFSDYSLDKASTHTSFAPRDEGGGFYRRVPSTPCSKVDSTTAQITLRSTSRGQPDTTINLSLCLSYRTVDNVTMTKEISVRYDTTFETPESFAEECKDELEGEIGLILDSTRVENLAKIVYDAIQPHTTPAIPNARTDVAGDDRPSVSALPPTLVLPLPPERPVSPISPQVSPSRRASTETTEPVPTVSRTASLELASANSEQDKRSASAPNTKPDQALTGQSHFQEHHSQPPQLSPAGIPWHTHQPYGNGLPQGGITETAIYFSQTHSMPFPDVDNVDSDGVLGEDDADLKHLEHEYEAKRKEIEDVYKKQLEKLELRLKTLEDDQLRKMNKLTEKKEQLRKQMLFLLQQQQIRYAMLDQKPLPADAGDEVTHSPGKPNADGCT